MQSGFWVLRFVVELRRARPDIELDEALRLGRSALLRTNGSPGQAAQFFCRRGQQGAARATGAGERRARSEPVV